MKTKLMCLIVAMVFLWCIPAMAIDESACTRYDPEAHAKGDNVTCLGLLEYDDMFNADGTIKASFQAIMNTWYTHPGPPAEDSNLIVGILPKIEDMVSEDVGTTVINFQIDNRRFADGREPDHRAKFVALQNAKRIPTVWAVQIDDPFPFEPELDFTCCNDEDGDGVYDDNLEYDWLFYPEDCPDHGSGHVQEEYGYVYPVIMYAFETNITQECIDVCEAQGWWWQPGDGSACAACFEDPDCLPFPGQDTPDNRCLPESYGGPTMRLVGDQVPKDQLTVTWNGETRGVGAREKETYWYKQWDQGHNYLSAGNGAPRTEPHYTSFMVPFSTQAPVGIHSYDVSIAGVVVDTFNREVFSNRVMPVVAATTEVLTVQDVKTNGKVKSKNLKTVVNVTAREMTNEAGETVLIVQWTAPDEALLLSPYEKSIRLRIYVGNGWFTAEDAREVDFAWIDAPLHTSSVVVPAEVYSWIKTTTLAKGINELDIAGMYREQFDGYHNRGYFEGVTFDLIQ